VKKNGERYWEFATISPVINEFGKVTHYIAIKEDVTERKKGEDALRRSEAKLKELNTTKDKFFSIIGHDIKGVFSSILVISDLLVQRVQENNMADLDQYSHMLNDVAKNGYALLENLLSWSRIQTGRIKFHPVEFPIIEVFQNVLELHKLSVDEKKISVKLDVLQGLTVKADRFMLETIVRNLVSNAIKFTFPDGRISISSKTIDDSIQVSISDSGVGINAEDVPKLFRIETSYSTPGTNSEMGTGLGLILCKEFVAKHNGHIWVESEVGKGTTIHFTLPNQKHS
jgi:signal transduction histidine kinase